MASQNKTLSLTPSTTYLWTVVIVNIFLSSSLLADIPVYYSTVIPPKVTNKALKAAGITATVFAKFKDFSNAVKTNKPNVLIAPGSFSEFNKDYDAAMQFYKKKDFYKYVVLSMDKKWKGADISNGKLGMVVIAKRKKLKGFVKNILGSKAKRVKTVSKAEDLFPLLVFKTVDFILISPDNYKSLKKKFTTKVFKIKKSKAINYPKVYIKIGGDVKKVKGTFSKLRAAGLKSMGFSKLK